MEIKRVTVVGAGIMGHSIAETVAIWGFPVILEDAFPEALKKAETSIKTSLERLKKSGKVSERDCEDTLQRIEFSSDLANSVKEADLIIEAVPEIPDLKVSLMREITENCRPDALVGSNTSNIRISTLAENAKSPQRILGMHFFNPPVLMKLVEVIKSESTSEDAFTTVFDFCKKIGKTPIKVLKDSPGFIVNRVNAPEGLFFCLVLEKGLTKPGELDAFTKSHGFPMGTCHLMDYVGIDTVVHSLNYYAQTLDRDYGKCKYFSRFIESNNLGLKTGKGFYIWENGHPKIPESKPTQNLEILDILSIQINEAVRLIEEGVAEPDDIDTGVKLGMGRRLLPIAVARELTNEEVKERLIGLSKKFDTRVFYPAKSIMDGKMREVVTGKLKFHS